MLSRRARPDFRVLGILVVIFGACGYEPPSVSTGSTSSASSSSSSGGGAEQSSSSSSGEGGVGGALVGSGGLGGTGVSTSASSSGNTSATPLVQNCPDVECNTSDIKAICCKPTSGDMGTCNTLTGACALNVEYSLKCDDRADCADGFYCCLDTISKYAVCAQKCTNGFVLCKDKGDCPTTLDCNNQIMGGLSVCGAP